MNITFVCNRRPSSQSFQCGNRCDRGRCCCCSDLNGVSRVLLWGKATGFADHEEMSGKPGYGHCFSLLSDEVLNDKHEGKNSDTGTWNKKGKKLY